MDTPLIRSVTQFVEEIEQALLETPFWWFRGQSVDKPLKPKLFRGGFSKQRELSLVQIFRMRAPVLGETPHRDDIDKWLFLMQHSGLPTRLLDWTEGALIALFFAVHDVTTQPNPVPVVWALNPLALNMKAFGLPVMPLSWVHFDPQGIDPSSPRARNIKTAFAKTDEDANKLPEAMHPTSVHMRMAVQRSCFTAHGSDPRGIDELEDETALLRDDHLRKYFIDLEAATEILRTLRHLGIGDSTLFPDLDHLASELGRVT